MFLTYDLTCILQANIYRQEKRFSEARELLDRAVRINPEFPAAWMNLGIVQASLGHFQDSANSYRSVSSQHF